MEFWDSASIYLMKYVLALCVGLVIVVVFLWFGFLRFNALVFDDSKVVNIKVNDVGIWKKFITDSTKCSGFGKSYLVRVVDTQQRNIIGNDRISPDYSYQISESKYLPVVYVYINFSKSDKQIVTTGLKQILIWSQMQFGSQGYYDTYERINNLFGDNIGIKL